MLPNSDETLERLIEMTNQTCLVALDKTLRTCFNHTDFPTYLHKSQRVSYIAERIMRAAVEVGLTLSPEQRAGYNNATTSTKITSPIIDNVTYLRTGTK